jgi:hypothetical protein
MTYAMAAAESFPKTRLYDDVDPSILARNEGVARSPKDILTGAWAAYLQRLLPEPAGTDRNPAYPAGGYSAASA